MTQTVPPAIVNVCHFFAFQLLASTSNILTLPEPPFSATQAVSPNLLPMASNVSLQNTTTASLFSNALVVYTQKETFSLMPLFIIFSAVMQLAQMTPLVSRIFSVFGAIFQRTNNNRVETLEEIDDKAKLKLRSYEETSDPNQNTFNITETDLTLKIPSTISPKTTADLEHLSTIEFLEREKILRDQIAEAYRDIFPLHHEIFIKKLLANRRKPSLLESTQYNLEDIFYVTQNEAVNFYLIKKILFFSSLENSIRLQLTSLEEIARNTILRKFSIQGFFLSVQASEEHSRKSIIAEEKRESLVAKEAYDRSLRYVSYEKERALLFNKNEITNRAIITTQQESFFKQISQLHFLFFEYISIAQNNMGLLNSEFTQSILTFINQLQRSENFLRDEMLSYEIHARKEIAHPFALYKIAIEQNTTRNEKMREEIHARFMLTHERTRDKIVTEALSNHTRLFSSHTKKSAAIISTEGKSYFDDYAEEITKNQIRETFIAETKTTRKEKTLTHASSKTFLMNDSEKSTPTSKSASSRTFLRTETRFDFNEAGNNKVSIVRESKPVDEISLQRTVIWRFEGKSKLTLEEKYNELTERAIAFRLAEKKAMQIEIEMLRASNATPARLAELELLNEKLKPMEIIFSVPNQNKTDRKSYSRDDFKEFSEFTIPDTISLTSHELFALKAHLRCFDVVTFHDITFSKKHPPEEIVSTQYSID